MNFRRLLLTVVLFISARAMGLAQTATLTPNVATLNAAGGQVTLTLAATFTGTAIYDLTVQLPGGWSYVSGTGEPSIRPTAGQTDKLEWAPLSLASNSAAFAFTVAYHEGLTSATITSVFGLRPANGSRLTITPSPVVFGGPPVIAHSGDTNKDFSLSLGELTRVIELYNTRKGTLRTGCYAVATTTTDDGFAADANRLFGEPVSLARYHSADSNLDGRFSLIELTRVIELFNVRSGTTRTGAYRVQAGSEDGFAPGP